MEEAQTEINQPIVESAWLDMSALPDEKTGIQRLNITLVLNGEHRRELYNSYCSEGLVLHSYNLTWMFNGLKERLAIAKKQLEIAKETLLEIGELTDDYYLGAYADDCNKTLERIKHLP